jgi:hypothetical protein
MTTQYLQKFTHAAVFDECNSWIERILIRAREIVAAGRSRRARQAQPRQFARLSARQLRDIGLDDPQVELGLFDTRIESGRESMESLRNRFQVRR